SATTTSTSVVTQNKSFSGGLGPGTGVAATSILRFPTALSAQSATSYNNSKNGSNTFTSAMAATVKDILPSGALVISGIQRIIINGQTQNMTVTGLARPEDIDNTDSIASSRLANVELKFDGNFQEGNKGVIRRILDWLF
ncbi:MAG: flagellar basal body L-ring protein FlgH, partial [Candidatus Eremiobacteraeota bacterium]|nr:flagellar basal body L-ring protein FlgH [Candidatus Eremiobacteraeota bacterium]